MGKKSEEEPQDDGGKKTDKKPQDDGGRSTAESEEDKRPPSARSVFSYGNMTVGDRQAIDKLAAEQNITLTQAFERWLVGKLTTEGKVPTAQQHTTPPAPQQAGGGGTPALQRALDTGAGKAVDAIVERGLNAGDERVKVLEERLKGLEKSGPDDKTLATITNLQDKILAEKDARIKHLEDDKNKDLEARLEGRLKEVLTEVQAVKKKAEDSEGIKFKGEDVSEMVKTGLEEIMPRAETWINNRGRTELMQSGTMALQQTVLLMGQMKQMGLPVNDDTVKQLFGFLGALAQGSASVDLNKLVPLEEKARAKKQVAEEDLPEQLRRK